MLTITYIVVKYVGMDEDACEPINPCKNSFISSQQFEGIWHGLYSTSTSTPLKFCPIVTLPSLIRKSPNSKRGPFDSIFACFFEFNAVCIFTVNKSNKESATTGICFGPASSIENVDAGCSELCSTWTVFIWPENIKQYRENKKKEIITIWFIDRFSFVCISIGFCGFIYAQTHSLNTKRTWILVHSFNSTTSVCNFSS